MKAEWMASVDAKKVRALIAAASRAVANPGQDGPWQHLRACVRDCADVEFHEAEVVLEVSGPKEVL